MADTFESIVHRMGICEKNFNILSEIIEIYLKNNNIHLALEQLERCASERERNMEYFKTVERNNKEKINSQHQWVIDRVRALMEKIRIGVNIHLTPNEWKTIEIKYKTNYFTVKYIPENSKDYFEIKKTTTSKPHISPRKSTSRKSTSRKSPSHKSPSHKSSSHKSPSHTSPTNVKNNKPPITKSMKRRLKKKQRIQKN